MNNPQVYISHAVSDRDWARAFAEALRQRGLHVWFDEFEIKPGEPTADALESALRESDVLVTVVEPHMLNAPNVFFELGVAIALGKRLVAIVPKDLDPARLPIEIRRRRYLFRDSPQETAEELSLALTAA
jgi:nucleoside 2-deoxyribosyltransferase